MSTFKVEVFKLGKYGRHKNADKLFITNVYGQPVIFSKDNNYKEGDLLAYVPVDAVVPFTKEWEWLGESARSHRIKAKRLRGVFSMGVLVPAPPGAVEGQDVAKELGITKYEEPETVVTSGECERDPGIMPCYTDIESLRGKYGAALHDGEHVVITEKIHGCNARYCFVYEQPETLWERFKAFFGWKKSRLWVGSRNTIKRDTPESLWWKVARKYDLKRKLSALPGYVFYGEIYGQVQDLKYGAGANEHFFRVFDVYDTRRGHYLGWAEVVEAAKFVGLETVPVLYNGAWEPETHKSLCDGESTLAKHIREGFVVRTFTEKFDNRVGRMIFKMVGEDYLTRKDGTEHH